MLGSQLHSDFDLFSFRDSQEKDNRIICSLPFAVPTVEFVMEESSVEEHQSNGTIEVTVREIQKTSKSDEECVGRAHEMRSAFETSHPGISRGTQKEMDVEVSSWS